MWPLTPKLRSAHVSLACPHDQRGAQSVAAGMPGLLVVASASTDAAPVERGPGGARKGGGDGHLSAFARARGRGPGRAGDGRCCLDVSLSLIHISEPTRQAEIS